MATIKYDKATYRTHGDLPPIGSRAPVGLALEGLRSTLEHIHEERQITITTEGTPPLTSSLSSSPSPR